MNMNNSILLIAVPLALAFAAPLFSMLGAIFNRFVLFAGILFEFIFAGYLMKRVLADGAGIAVIGGWKPPFGINLQISYLPLFFLLIIYFVMIIASLMFAARKSKKDDSKLVAAFLLFVTGMSGVILTGDIFNMFVFFEILTIATIILIAAKGKPMAMRGAIKYSILSSIASAFFLLSIAFIYGTLGTLNIAEIALMFPQIAPLTATFIFIMFFGALLAELEMFPFNMWAPDSYEGSYSFVNVLLSSAASLTAVYAFIRIAFTGMGYTASGYIRPLVPFDGGLAIVFIGALTAIIGEISALSSRNIKRMLAFSSIGQMGLIMTGVGIGSETSIGAALILLINLALSKALLFLSTGAMLKGSDDRGREALTGIAYRDKLFPVLFILGAAGTVGVPFTLGFYGKLFIAQSLISAGGFYFILLLLVFAGAVIELFYYFRVIHSMYIKKEFKRELDIKMLYYIAGAVLVGAVLFFIFNPSSAGQFTSPAVRDIFERAEYIGTVLGTGVLK